MRVLVFGAGAVGSLYAARLAQSGQDVTLLARGERWRELQDHGLVLEDARTGERALLRVPLARALEPSDAYDLVLVTLRKNQMDAALPILAANVATPAILFMVNTAEGYGPWISAVGRERILAGTPGCTGARFGRVVRWAMLSRILQATTLGEIDGRRTQRLQAIAGALRAAGFPVALCRDMDAWQKTYVAWVSPLASAVSMAGGQARALARDREALGLLVSAIRENFAVLDALGVPVTPRRLGLARRLPRRSVAWAVEVLLRGKAAELALEQRGAQAQEEMRELAAEMRVLARSAALTTPAYDRLCAFG
jgi:2-dehydropantoate 2-reductase